MQALRSRVAIKNILFATDFSEESAHAIDYVRSLRHGYDAQIHVLHVVDLFPYSLSEDPGAAGQAQAIRHQAEARVRDFMLVHRFDSRHFKPAIVSGEVGEAVERFAGEHEIDLVVLGSRGDLGLNRLFLGSAAEEIFRSAHCPVLTVGPLACAPPKDGRFKHLLFATDFSAHSKSALAIIQRLLQDEPESRITLAHFLAHDGKSESQRRRTTAQLECDLAGLLPDDLKARIEGVILQPGGPAQAMVSAAARIPADLLVLGVRYGGSFLRASTHGLFSITSEVIGKAPCPVLTVRESAHAAPAG